MLELTVKAVGVYMALCALGMWGHLGFALSVCSRKTWPHLRWTVLQFALEAVARTWVAWVLLTVSL